MGFMLFFVTGNKESQGQIVTDATTVFIEGISVYRFRAPDGFLGVEGQEFFLRLFLPEDLQWLGLRGEISDF